MADVLTAKHASESGHWYDEVGNQIVMVPDAAMRKNPEKGKLIKCTLRQARVLGYAPGVTTITSQSHRADLENWKINQAIKASLALTKHTGETDLDFIERIKDEAADALDKLSSEGTRIHAALQSHYQGEQFDEAYAATVNGAVTCLDLTCGPQQWIAEHGVTSRLGYGTKIDLLSDLWVIDWKSKDGDLEALQKMKVYDGYEMQLAAGRAAVADNKTRRCADIYVSRTHPGVSVFKPVEEERLQRAWAMFRHLLAYYFEMKKYRPPFAIAA